MLTKDLALAGYNILLYPGFLYKLAKGKNQVDKMFVYKGEVSFNFEDLNDANLHVNIVDIIYNRRGNFTSSKYSKSAISNIKKDDKVILCFDHQGRQIVCSPFILSEMELVKAIPLIA
jgi:hypothetical protein